MQQMIDDFNYPTPQRKDTMSLQTVQQALEAPSQRKQRAEPLGLRIDDIPGAQVGTTGNLRKMRFTKNKPDLFNKDDIAGANPIRLIPTDVHKSNHYNLSNKDIEFSSPMTHTFKSGRMTDPNAPNYKLPSCEQKPPTPLKQLVESLKLSDIEGSAARPLHLTTNPTTTTTTTTRQTMTTTDIQGTTADSTRTMRTRSKFIPPTMDNNTVHAINTEGTLKTNRTVDPLSPRYRYDVPPGADETWSGIGEIAGNHSKGMPGRPKPAEHASLSLRTDDISGAHPVITMPRPHKRRHYRNPVDITDIDCASPSMKHTKFQCTSRRHLDPLNPEYPPLRYRPDLAGTMSSKANATGSSKHNGGGAHFLTDSSSPTATATASPTKLAPTSPMKTNAALNGSTAAPSPVSPSGITLVSGNRPPSPSKWLSRQYQTPASTPSLVTFASGTASSPVKGGIFSFAK
eukprot:TRINITY_DN67209_c5_g7_i1.p1 TRINITY_DN67209_c5_g7~~TRINITY_DN67209_c5_g7_i1.p1  ORF type:complete len:457 (+),score=33.72 TRINITY_DN67209_c5_g7_i1:31-1401(+)